MSNLIRYDSLLVHYLAAELDERLRARRLKGVWLDPAARRFSLVFDDFLLVWELHPERGWLREIRAGGDAGPEAGLRPPIGWAGRRIPTQRRPRVRGVSAPSDERLVEIAIDAGGAGRPSRFVVELMTNQWNVLALAPDATIVTALWPRDAGSRRLRAGVAYEPPEAGRARAGLGAPIPEASFRSLLADVEPAARMRALVADVAWTSPLNAPAILGRAGLDADPALLSGAWQRYAAVASLPAPSPRVLDLGGPHPYPLPLPGVAGEPALSLLAAFEMAVSPESPTGVAPEVRAALEARLEKVAKRAVRLRRDAEVAPADAERLRREADLLMSQLHRVERSDASVELDDFEGGTVTVSLDPALTAAENAGVLYDRARRRERASARLPERVREAVAEQNRLESLLEALDRGDADPAELAKWVAEVRPTEGAAADEEARLPYHRFMSSGGLEIRVGRSGSANDELTFHHASPDDIWLHARDSAGAHVILRWGEREQNPPKRDLVEAAVLAALNSRARGSATVPVDWTRRKYVRKPRKAPAGAVVPERVSTVFVRPDPDLPGRLSRG